MNLQTWELLSYVVTVIGLPFAIAVYLLDQRREQENDEEAIFEKLSNGYQEFLQVALANPDLRLFSVEQSSALDASQRERMLIIFSMLVSLFERAFLLLWEEDMGPKERRRWSSWDDYMREWCRRADFREALPDLLKGEDPDFARYLMQLLSEETGRLK